MSENLHDQILEYISDITSGGGSDDWHEDIRHAMECIDELIDPLQSQLTTLTTKLEDRDRVISGLQDALYKLKIKEEVAQGENERLRDYERYVQIILDHYGPMPSKTIMDLFTKDQEVVKRVEEPTPDTLLGNA